jgi:hypothetical protein
MEIYVMHNGQQLGPFSLESVQAQLDCGFLSAADYAWSVDIDDMTSLSEVMSKARELPIDADTPKKRPRQFKIIGALRGIPEFVDQQLTIKKFLAGTVLLLIASWIYPPWVVNGHSHGWFFVFDTTRNLEMRVDFGRLFLIDLTVAGLGTLLGWAAFHNWTPFRVAAHLVLYSLLFAPLAAVICFSTFLVQGHVVNRASLNALPYIGAIPVSAPLAGERENPALVNAAATPAGQQLDSEPGDELAVAPTDLNKIDLFDLGVHGYRSSITGFYGRVRNGLKRAVQKIGVRASFYTSADELIEVRTFWMKHGVGVSSEGPILPNAPISFDEHLLVDHLPEGYKYQLQVTEARYAN